MRPAPISPEKPTTSLDLQGDLADGHVVALGEAVLHLTADHAADDPVLADVVRALVQRFDGFAVPQDGDVIRHIGDLVDLVGDEDGGHALLLEFQQQVQQRLGVLLVEGGGGLVQDHEAGVLGQSLGDLHQLLLADADILDQGFGGFGQADDLQIFRCLGMGLVPVDGKFFSLFVPQEHVFPDAHIGHQRQLLVDDDDAFFFAVLDFGELAYFSVVYDVSAVAAVGIPAAEHVHQRGLSRAVFADQGVDAAPLHGKVDVVKGLDPREFLGDPPHFQNVVRQNIPSRYESL